MCYEVPGKRAVAAMQWGGMPGAKDAYSTFNARGEALTQSGLWRRLVDTRRCIVVVDGFYEWQRGAAQKTPVFISQTLGLFAIGSDEVPKEEAEEGWARAPGMHGIQPLLLAGLFDTHPDGTHSVQELAKFVQC